MSPSKRGFNHDRAVALVVDRLHQRYPDVARETLTTTVQESVTRLEAAPITDFIDVLAERDVRKTLKLGPKRAP